VQLELVLKLYKPLVQWDFIILLRTISEKAFRFSNIKNPVLKQNYSNGLFLLFLYSEY
jgi:hypothetical protein